MITGFNTDIEHDGVVYHVQTEDKGLDSPLILSLVYSGGAILASKRSRYEDLIAAGFNEEVLAERLKRQHRLICAAINAGRLEDLKRMGAKAPSPSEAVGTPPAVTVADESPEVIVVDAVIAIEPEFVVEPEIVVEPEMVVEPEIEVESKVEPLFEIVALSDEPKTTEPVSPPVQNAEPEPTSELIDELELSPEVVPVKKKRRSRLADDSAYSVYDPRRQDLPAEVQEEEEGGFALSLLDDEEEFRAGESYMIRVLVEDRTGRKRKPLGGVGVSLKVLGTAFRPQIYSVKTERDGVATVDASMPSFTTGRAAVLIRVVVKGEPREVRRVIHPAE
ncbi:MAG TPA: hypothetical protein VGN90_00080 [Pyrinomonadaceae bacterium]|nr:hypothetical protein [Pyrinomonadaceae bacterium]